MIIGIEHGDILSALVRDDVALQAHVFVPTELVEVIGGDIGDGGDGRGPIGVLELGVADLEDDVGAGRDLVQAPEERLADVSANDEGLAGFSGNCANERRGGGFPARPGDADNTAGAELQEEPHLGSHRHAEFARAGECGVVAKNRLGDRHQVVAGGVEQRLASHEALDAAGRGRPGGGELGIGPGIAERDGSAVSHHPAREVTAFDAERVHQHALTADIHGGCQERTVGCRHYSGTSRARATPAMAATMEMSQKRVTIWVSAQPMSSRWWWNGARRKMRLPPLSL